MGNEVVIDNLESYSSQISSLVSDTTSAVQSSIESFNGMGDGWQGKSYQAYTTCYNSLLTHLNYLPKAMAEVANAISTVSRNYQVADNEDSESK